VAPTSDGRTVLKRAAAPGIFVNRDMTQRLVAPPLDFGGTPSMCVVVSNREKPMDTTPSSFTARNNAKRAAEKMIANGKAPAVDYGIRPRDDGRFEIVWKTAPTIGEVEASTNPLLSVNEDPSDAPPYAGAEEAAAAAGNKPAASSVPASGAPERDNKWPDGTRVMVRNKPKSWSEATIYTRLDAEYWRVQYPSGGTGMFKEVDIRAYDPKRDATPATQRRRAKATAPHKSPRSRYAIDPEAIAAGKLPDKAPAITSEANPHYQKHFDRLLALAKAGDWHAVRDYKVTGSNSYSKMVARYRQDLLALHAASEAAQ
jgi:hypothetical protein